MTFDCPLTVHVDVDSGELRFELGEPGDPSAPTLISVDGRTAIPEGPLDEEDKAVLADPRVERAWLILAGAPVEGVPPWDWAEDVAAAANVCLTRVSKRRD